MIARNRHQSPDDTPQSSRHSDESREIAHDRGRDRARRHVSGSRQYDELESEIEDHVLVDDSDDMRMDDGLGGPDREERQGNRRLSAEE